MEFEGIKQRLAQTSTLLPSGRVESVVGLAVRVSLAAARVGDVIVIQRRGPPLLAQVVGIDGGQAVAMPLGDLVGVGAGDRVETRGSALEVRVGDELLGRVLNGLGEPVDGRPALQAGASRPVESPAPPALSRRPVDRPLATGVRVIDGLMTLGEGQRVGLFAGSGVGKSMLLGAIARGTAADVVVVALVGERGREVGEFLDKSLGEQGLAKSVVVVATSDAPALERLAAAQVATAVAEHFRDQGAKVMLLVDSVTRFARAQREVGLAAGEPPARRGYPPSVFAMLPRLLERSGQGDKGSITAIYTVLVEGGDMDEPIADEVRGILDGHIVLDRAIAARGRYPAVDVLNSLSRVMSGIVGKEHREAAARARRVMGTFEAKRDLIALGAYAKGSDRELDAAIAMMPKIEAFLGQAPDERTALDETVARLGAIRP
ncbi:MAG: FliI/YscN family ATPase [Deltaproteobacteria bacterium]|nr:FliI/YscN family ATPase [Deltaproteobacteria bacterium]